MMQLLSLMPDIATQAGRSKVNRSGLMGVNSSSTDTIGILEAPRNLK